MYANTIWNIGNSQPFPTLNAMNLVTLIESSTILQKPDSYPFTSNAYNFIYPKHVDTYAVMIATGYFESIPIHSDLSVTTLEYGVLYLVIFCTI